VVSVDTIFCSGSRVQADSNLVQGRRVNLACDASRRWEWLFRGLVGNELELYWRQLQQFDAIRMCGDRDQAYRPKEASASDVANIWVTVEVLM
jgi:hypothetical protein